MLLFWNRKELWSGFDMEKAMVIRSILKAKGIPFTTKYRGSGEYAAFGGRTGAARVTEIQGISTIFVSKKDYGKACYALKKVI